MPLPHFFHALRVNEFDLKSTQLNPDSYITILIAVENISYLSIYKLRDFLMNGSWSTTCEGFANGVISREGLTIEETL